MLDNFTVFILTHGRPDSVYTINSLIKHGYTGNYYLVVDDEDSTIGRYQEIYGDKVLLFNKKEIAKTFDLGDSFNNDKCIIFARNVCFELAKKMGVTYFIQLDDDYTSFTYRVNNIYEYGDWGIKNLNSILDAFLEFYKNTPTLTIAMSQTGDFIGGKKGTFGKLLTLRRKAMNTFICSTERPFSFFGRINEDVNTYVTHGGRGNLFFTYTGITVQQKSTQSNDGGMTEFYLNNGTYVKSFYSVIYSPSCVKVTEMNSRHKRLHHKVSWNNAVPKILNEQYKKAA